MINALVCEGGVSTWLSETGASSCTPKMAGGGLGVGVGVEIFVGVGVGVLVGVGVGVSGRARSCFAGGVAVGVGVTVGVGVGVGVGIGGGRQDPPVALSLSLVGEEKVVNPPVPSGERPKETPLPGLPEKAYSSTTILPLISRALSLDTVFQLKFPLAKETQVFAGNTVLEGMVNFSVPPLSSTNQPEVSCVSGPVLRISTHCEAPDGST